jgi:hypothetical protein
MSAKENLPALIAGVLCLFVECSWSQPVLHFNIPGKQSDENPDADFTMPPIPTPSSGNSSSMKMSWGMNGIFPDLTVGRVTEMLADF